jgi:hypothetical protein
VPWELQLVIWWLKGLWLGVMLERRIPLTGIIFSLVFAGRWLELLRGIMDRITR